MKCRIRLMSSVTYPFITLIPYPCNTTHEHYICNHDEYMTIWLCAKQGIIVRIMILDYFCVEWLILSNVW